MTIVQSSEEPRQSMTTWIVQVCASRVQMRLCRQFSESLRLFQERQGGEGAETGCCIDIAVYHNSTQFTQSMRHDYVHHSAGMHYKGQFSVLSPHPRESA